MRDIIFIGANNPEVLAMLDALGPSGKYRFLGFVDNDRSKKGTSFCGLPVHGTFSDLTDLSPDSISFVNLITRDAETRFETSKAIADLGFRFENFIHPSVDLSGVTLGTGNYIQRNTVLQIDVKIGHNACINSGSVVSHESSIGSSCFIAPGVTIAGLVAIQDGALIGAGATILPRLKVGAWSVVGGGAVVTKDVPPNTINAGVPAQTMRTKSEQYKTGNPWGSDDKS